LGDVSETIDDFHVARPKLQDITSKADWNFPLKLQDAHELLKVLDALIDLGDRRSAALEQTEAFRGIQGQEAW